MSFSLPLFVFVTRITQFHPFPPTFLNFLNCFQAVQMLWPPPSVTWHLRLCTRPLPPSLLPPPRATPLTSATVFNSASPSIKRSDIFMH
jgi:hypothetical protein